MNGLDEDIGLLNNYTNSESSHLDVDMNVDSNVSADSPELCVVTRSTQPASSPYFVFLLTFLSAIGGLLFGYDTGVIAGAIILLELDYSLSSIWREAIVSIPMASAAIFSLISGAISDSLGRKVTILIASLMFIIGAVLLAASINQYMLLVGRFVIGIGIGLASSTVPMYIAECAPCHLRGRLVTLNNVFITSGQFIASIVSGAFSYDRQNGWRYMFGLAAIPPFLQFIGFLFMPESPRWLFSKKKPDKARAVLQRIRGTSDVERELCDIEETCFQGEEMASGSVIRRMLTTVAVRRALLVGCMLQFFQQIVGINTVMYYSATIIKMSGIGSNSSAIWLSAVTAAVNCVFTFVGFYLVDRVGRRLLTVVSLIGVLFSLVFLGIGFQLAAVYAPDITFVESAYQKDHSSCANYSTCNGCMMDTSCGFCYVSSSPRASAVNGSCLPVSPIDMERSSFGRCSSSSSSNTSIVDPVATRWAYSYCPTNYAWMTVVGLMLYLAFFAPGMGPMPWTINAEIYPLWARGTGNSIATCVNWVTNLAISMTFITLTEAITRYGVFYLYSVFALVGVVVFVLCLPETKGKQLEDIEKLFSRPLLVYRRTPSYERFVQ